MKRLMCLLLMLTILAGCGAPAAEPETPQLTGEELAADVAALYHAMAEDETFVAAVQEPDDTLYWLPITPDNAWNVKNRDIYLADSFQWSPATEAEWLEQEGTVLTLYGEEHGGAEIQCVSSGDVIRWMQEDGTVRYARAVNPKEGQESYEGKFYDFLLVIAQDAYSGQVWSGAVDGSLPTYDAANALAEQIAENYRNVPDWVIWKPLDVQAGGAEVFDVYRGEPENFCCGMGFQVKLENYMSADAGYWMAGAGLDNPDEQGYSGWGQEVLVEKKPDGDWVCTDRGTGGYSVLLPLGRVEDASLKELLDAFFLTEGFTHEWLLPYYILSQSPETLSTLPELLAGRSEAEVRDFCAMLMGCYRRYDEAEDDDDIPGAAYPGEWVTQAELRTALGEYGVYLDA